MTSVHTVMPGSFTFDTTLPPKLDINVGATSHFFLPPKTPSASTSLHKSTNSLSTQDVGRYPSRKRSRYDSYMSDQATPFSAQSHAWSSISPTTPSLETPEAMSPVPFVSTKYELAGGLDTPAAARSSAMESGDDPEADLHLRGGRGFRGFDLAAESYFPISAPTLARESNGRARTQNPPRLRDGLGKAVYGLAGKVLEFCKATAFKGFYAGGGQGYEIKSPTQSAAGGQSIWLDEENDNELRTFARETSAVPGGFPEEDFIPEYMSQDHSTPPRAAKKVRREHGTAEVGASWVLVGSNPTSREASPSRLSHRKVPSAYSSLPLQPRPKLSRRPILPASRPSQTSFAGSPAMRPDRPASYASSRSPMTSPTKHPRESPVSVEVQRHAARMRKRELQEDANLKRFNQQLKAMIKEGKEALGTKFEVEEDEDDEPMDEGYAEGAYFDNEKWRG